MAVPPNAASTRSLSVSIVYYDTHLGVFYKALECLAVALKRASDAPRIVIVDNSGSLDGAAVRARIETAMAGHIHTLDVLQDQGNVGYGRGHNLALPWVTSAGDHLILNPDVYLAPDSLQTARATLAARSNRVALTPNAVDGSGARQYLAKRYPDMRTLLIRAGPSWLDRRVPTRNADYELRAWLDGVSRPVDGIPLAAGCFLLCRGDVLRRVGGFDPAYFMYFEDFDLCLRLRAHGTIVFDPSVRITHLGGHTGRKSLRHIWWFLASAGQFFTKYQVRI